MKLKLIITDSALFFWRNLNQIALLCMPWLFAGAVVEYLVAVPKDALGDTSMYFAAWIFNMLLYPIYTAALIHLMALQAQGKRPGNLELFRLALKSWQSLLILHIMSSVLFLCGLMLFVLPGIWVIVRLSFSQFYLVLENLNPIEAIQKSFFATRKHMTAIFLLIIAFLIPVFVLSLVIGHLIAGIPQAQPFIVIAETILSFYVLFVYVLIFRVFMSAVKDGPEEPQE
jgi:flagellar biosynthesis protein FlhB